MSSPSETSDSTLKVAYMSEGPIPATTRDRAQAMMEKLAAISPRPVIFARVKVKVDENRNPDEQTVVQGTMDISGSVIRAQAAEMTPRQALGILESRLERRLTRLAERRETANERPPSTPPGEWRKGDLPSQRPGFYQRPPGDRRVIRKKTYAPEEEVPVSEAVFDLDVLDYRFFLFTDASDGKASIVYEEEDGIVLRKIDGGSPLEDEAGLGIAVNQSAAPAITVEDAIDRLNVSDEPFIFFMDPEADQASVLYRRYDGHYGLIVPTTAGS